MPRVELAATIRVAAENAIYVMRYCDSYVDFANIHAAVGNVGSIYDNLNEHHQTGGMDLNTIQKFLDDFQRLAIRMKIEVNLLEEGDDRTSLYQLPASEMGYLETTRDIVVDTINMNLAAGLTVGNALTELAAGHAAFFE